MPNEHGPHLFFLSVNYELHGQFCQNGFWFTENLANVQSADPGVQIQALVNQFHLTVWPKMVEFQNNQVHYRNIVGVTINPKNGPIAELTIESQTGAQGNESLPSYCAAVLSLRTGLGGKSNRGRLYIAGVSEDFSADSRLLPDSLTGLQGIGDELLTRFGPADSLRVYNYGVWSRVRALSAADGPAPQVDFAFTQITQCIPRGILGTQKHRQIGHGG